MTVLAVVERKLAVVMDDQRNIFQVTRWGQGPQNLLVWAFDGDRSRKVCDAIRAQWQWFESLLDVSGK